MHCDGWSIDKPMAQRRVSIIEGKMTLTHFDGSARSSVRKWIQELDTYFQLNSMREVSTCHFSLRWRCYGMVILRVDPFGCITSYKEFTQRLVERFDWKETRPPQRDWIEWGKLEDETRRHFYSWIQGFRCQNIEEDVEKKDTQDGEGHIDIPDVAEESPLLEASLVAPSDTSVEGVDHTLGGPSIDGKPMVYEVPSAMTHFLDDGYPE